MKTRQGFVSNSSSSSFVIIGALIDGDKFDITEIAKNIDPKFDGSEDSAMYLIEKDWYYSDHYESGAPEGKVMIGKMIADFDDYSSVTTVTTLPDIEDIQKQINELLSNTKLTDKDKEINIITGTRMC